MYDNRRSTTLNNSMLLPVVCHVSCGLRQRHYRIIRCTLEGFTKATCPLLPTNESIVFEQTLRARTTINHNTLICGCPLLITPGQCAEFIYKESEDLADLQAITPPSENVLRLHLSLWSVSKKSAKSPRKLSTTNNRSRIVICQALRFTPFSSGTFTAERF